MVHKIDYCITVLCTTVLLKSHGVGLHHQCSPGESSIAVFHALEPRDRLMVCLKYTWYNFIAQTMGRLSLLNHWSLVTVACSWQMQLGVLCQLRLRLPPSPWSDAFVYRMNSLFTLATFKIGCSRNK